MGCNPRRWIWGFLPIAILSWIAGLNEYDRIEEDLRVRTEAALVKERLGWAAASFDGRDGALSGNGWRAGEAARALDVARGVWGVRAVDDRTDLPTRVDSTIWSASVRGDRVKLAGFVPNEPAQKAILGVTRAAFPKSEIADRMKIARGAAPQPAWLGGVSFALEQLSFLKRGIVTLDGANLSVAGEAESPEAYKSLKAALRDSLPAGLRLASDRIVAPTVRPYAWEARIEANQLVLSGYVPSEDIRDKLFGHAKGVMPWMTIVDHTEIAIGAPPNWRNAVEAGLDQLARLEAGAVVLRDAEAVVEGVAPDDATAEQVRATLRKSMPSDFKASATVRSKALPVETASPFVTVVSALNGHVELTGHSPSNSARAALVSKIASQSPGRAVDDRLRIAAGAPTGWQECLDAGLLALGRLGGVGRIELSDRRLAVSGRTQDEAVAEAIPAEVKSAASAACDVDLNIDLIMHPEPRLTWRAKWRGDEVVFEGEVPDASTKAELARTAGEVFPGRRISDRATVAGVPASKWPGVAALGLRQLARLRHGAAVLSGNELTINGETADSATAISIRQQLTGAIAKGYMARDVLDIRTDAVKGAEHEAKRRAEAAETERAKDAAPAPGGGTANAEREALASGTPRADHETGVPSSGMSVTSGSRDWARVATAGREPRGTIDQCQEFATALARENAIHFERSSATLDARSRPTLDKLARIANLCPRARIEIAGHTDAEGGAEKNVRLSRQRAQSVASWLADAGVDAGRLRAIGYGETRPAAPNDTAENRAKNRRIEYAVKMNY